MRNLYYFSSLVYYMASLLRARRFILKKSPRSQALFTLIIPYGIRKSGANHTQAWPNVCTASCTFTRRAPRSWLERVLTCRHTLPSTNHRRGIPGKNQSQSFGTMAELILPRFVIVAPSGKLSSLSSAPASVSLILGRHRFQLTCSFIVVQRRSCRATLRLLSRGFFCCR